MRNPHSISQLLGLLLFGIMFSFTQVSAFTSMSHPLLGIKDNKSFAPRDSTFSIKLHSGQKLMKAQTTLTLNMGGYKQLRYLKMYDLIGKKVVFLPLSYKPGIATYQIKLATLKPGIYVCSVYSDFGLVETRKLVHF